MSDRPIIFSAPMIRALLDGRKTMTRRVVRSKSLDMLSGKFGWRFASGYKTTNADPPWVEAVRPTSYGAIEILAITRVPCRPGDRLWVRENFARVPSSAYRNSEGVFQTEDPADRDFCAVYSAEWERSKPGAWKPSIHMPRWASRLTLIVESVKVERLNSISEADALAEGIVQSKASFEYDEGHGTFEKEQDWFSVPGMPDPGCGTSATDMFAMLWESINGPGSWDANPFVAAISFRVIKANIDQIDAPTPTTR